MDDREDMLNVLMQLIGEEVGDRVSGVWFQVSENRGQTTDLRIPEIRLHG